MPELPNNQPPKDLSMETRLLIAFVLMFAVLFASQYLYKSDTGPVKTAPAVTPAQAVQETKPPPPAATTSAQTPAKPTAAPMPGSIQDTAEHEFTIDTALYKIRLTNKGGAIQSWLLKKYLDHNGKPLELVNSAGLVKVPSPFALLLKDQ